MLQPYTTEEVTDKIIYYNFDYVVAGADGNAIFTDMYINDDSFSSHTLSNGAGASALGAATNANSQISIVIDNINKKQYYYNGNELKSTVTAKTDIQTSLIFRSKKNRAYFNNVSYGVVDPVINGEDSVAAGGSSAFSVSESDDAVILHPDYTISLAEGTIEGVTIENGIVSIADTVPDGNEVTLYAYMGDGENPVAPKTITVFETSLEKKPTPEIQIDYLNEMLTAFGEGNYEVNGEAVSPIDGKIGIDESNFGENVLIVKKGDNITTLDSDIQTLPIPARPTLSADDLNITQPSEIGGTGSVAGITDAMEYSTYGGVNWIDGGTTLSDIAGGTTILVHIKATDSTFKSDNYTINIEEYVPALLGSVNVESKTYSWDIGTGYTAEEAGVTYTDENDNNYVDLTVSLGEGDSIDETIKFSSASVGNSGNLSATERYLLVTPEYDGTFSMQVAFSSASSSAKNRIYYVDAGVDALPLNLEDYAKSSPIAGEDITSTSATTRTIDMLAEHTYVIYTFQKGCSISELSYTYSEQRAVPEITIDYANEMLTGFIEGYEYTISVGGNEPVDVVPSEGKLSISEYIGQEISIVAKGAGSTVDSAAGELEIFTRPVAPTESDFTVTQPDSVDGTGSIAGITSSMEYSIDDGETWVEGTDAEVSVAGGTTCMVRIKATENTFKSDSYSITVAAFVPTATPSPTPTVIPSPTPTATPSPTEYLDVLDAYDDILLIEKSYDENENVILTVSPKDGKELPILTLFTAIYDENGILKGLELVSCEITDGRIIIPVSEPDISGGETYKLMLWTDGQIPLIKAISSDLTDFFNKQNAALGGS